MNAALSDPIATPRHVDVLIVGAGISGIGMAAHLAEKCPDRSYGIVEQREQLGGTWDLFRYPGVRSDSDMHTLGFAFEPWEHEKSIADGASILEYLNRIVDERDIRRHIRFSHRVLSADFDTATALWTVTMEANGAQDIVTASWLYLGSGYYDYDQPYDPGLPIDDFAGRVVHPQFWPDDLDYTGKRVVVIGSGATAVTIVPSMAAKARHVTMLQRTPTWMFARPSKDGLANFLRRVLPSGTAYRITRWKNVLLQDVAFRMARQKPRKMANTLTKRIARSLGEKFEPKAFTPPYDPWDQRICLVPDEDLFAAMRDGKASIVTGHIAGFEQDGVRLDDGTLLEADIVVTATGLNLAVLGKIAISLDGERVDFSERFYYKGCMFSNMPNLSVVFGYLNASWTLRADLNADYVCRVLNAMAAKGATLAMPVLTEAEEKSLVEDDVFDFSSGYIQRSKHIMPRNAVRHPWRLNQNYRQDRKWMAESPVEDGILTLTAVRKTQPRRVGEAIE